ncbi:MAG: carboxylating nicotinate-nucleotide diphosphorylase [Dokdonella sp.]|jgi:nicotinate-nucleotide pyrophosphorylase (carboxylating)|uniref:carboxylating nicotinate-nucleotide diphosphorylase n=1 Tax=Dokdonella sp. TaxID=2291710 RepID=UPI001B6C0871|nr:carboxylating nicotinate-nucleotide diphosphorylase [Dokdonella sp.]MCC6439783.1 carboxylating nicotinate-nucleotide diphosphorylase [Rhodanobacteraceae bacterium]MBK8122636.1 carboxylating nicotinate-nucleotide diphosphorylase [Dokdonella sp.]MBP6325672.1 carboxylating nicotinate-nucleotide diphosphorylase [Dokdonella sp.]MBP6328595.1 carboxylating nicotinate-nucleotide diphosphorylase [Dokdonella sp.]HQV48175.1 carboxylating nicotinate-nucleotide diphosphorylase [Dokdonella sp.]
MHGLNPLSIERDVRRALQEDLGSGDVTADLLPEGRAARARVITRQPAIICGQAWFDACFHLVDADVSVEWLVAEGDRVSAGQTLCHVAGRARALVSAERSALNFLQTLSATATTTATYVEAIRGTRTRILDTRKTLPGLREAQKYAVRTGGGENHRMGLHDAILLKENHILAAGSLTSAVTLARKLHPAILLEVEVETFGELREALSAGVDRIMLDEFELEELVQAVAEVDGRVPLEVSGGVGIERVRAIAETGVDYISIGALTKHVQAIDLSMRIVLIDGTR